MINILDKKTIDQIAAGEVVERPSSVVKELVENSVDAGATAVTVEIKDGGVQLIRITDNGWGINAEEVRTAFYRHATSKIKSSEDLLSISSLGFRGEALSSIASIAKVELITKTKDSFTGTRYVIEGGEEISNDECGCPDGTTFLIKDLFYNTPARRKFLKSATTETGYITELVEKLALSHPEVSFKLIAAGRVILHTSGNGKLSDVMLELYGIDTAKALLEIDVKDEENALSLSGVICKPHVSRGNRAYEGFFVNGRFIRSKILSGGLEDGYKGFMMGHSFPVCALFLNTPGEFVDVNVHPSKMELKFSNNEAVYSLCLNAVRNALMGKNMIIKAEPEDDRSHSVIVQEKKQELNKVHIPEPFEKKPTFENNYANNFVSNSESNAASNTINSSVSNTLTHKETSTEVLSGLEPIKNNEFADLSESKQDFAENTPDYNVNVTEVKDRAVIYEDDSSTFEKQENTSEELIKEKVSPIDTIVVTDSKQEELPLDLFQENKREFKLIGQVFLTYWLIEMDNTLFIIDQHAAHEKVLFEKTMRRLRAKEAFNSQALMPGQLLTLSIREAEVLKNNLAVFERLGFEISEFGGSEFTVTGVPAELVDIDLQDLFKDTLNNLMNERETKNPDLLLDRIATISCKAAVKGNNYVSEAEMKQLITDMFELDDPYHCPHGRPTTISITKYEMEKKFKRIL